MAPYKQEFITFMLDCGVLQFGDFITKSGRKTPFFINTGFYRTGSQLKKLGAFYARAIQNAVGTDIDVLFGPAYKGIPLAVATAIALEELFGKEVRYAANRKEIKDHGEQGILLGSPLKDGDRVLIIEDVTTAGTSIRETMPILQAQAKVKPVGLVVSVDRMERGETQKSALSAIGKTYHMTTTAIVTMQEVVAYLKETPYRGKMLLDETLLHRIEAYYKTYGAQ